MSLRVQWIIFSYLTILCIISGKSEAQLRIEPGTSPKPGSPLGNTSSYGSNYLTAKLNCRKRHIFRNMLYKQFLKWEKNGKVGARTLGLLNGQSNCYQVGYAPVSVGIKLYLYVILSCDSEMKNTCILQLFLFNPELNFVKGISLSYENQIWWFFFEFF